jgi:hypothetical protein
MVDNIPMKFRCQNIFFKIFIYLMAGDPVGHTLPKTSLLPKRKGVCKFLANALPA